MDDDKTKTDDFYAEQPHKVAIDRAWKKLKDYMNPNPIIDLARQERFFLYEVIRDISELPVTSDKNEKIIKHVRAKGYAAYDTFKTFLRKSNQTKLAEFLECVENRKATEEESKKLDAFYNKKAGYGIQKVLSSTLGTTQKYANQTKPDKLVERNLIFSDDFDGEMIDLCKWKHEISAYGGGHWEFQIYSPESENSYIKNNVLHLRPTLTAEKFGEQFLYNGTLDVEKIWGKCTNETSYGGYRDSKYGIIPPIMSAKIMIQEHFSFNYGRVEIEAQMPIGDWIRSTIQMVPKEKIYGDWPRSGQITIAESRGNRYCGSNGAQNVTCALHWGTDWNENRWNMTNGQKKMADGTWGDDFHTYFMDWTPDHIVIGVDGVQVMEFKTPEGGYFKKGFFGGENIWRDGGIDAPFDREFYLQFSVAVGGTSDFFPDFEQSDGHDKPWSNKDPRAAQTFYESRDMWMDSWKGDDTALKIRSVKIWSDDVTT